MPPLKVITQPTRWPNHHRYIISAPAADVDSARFLRSPDPYDPPEKMPEEGNSTALLGGSTRNWST